MIGHRILRIGAALGALTATAAATPPVELDLRIENARDAKGMLLVCMTDDAAHFPNCRADPRAIKAKVPATAREVRLIAPHAGPYAVAVIHDANGNGKLDTTLGIPREGFGFSRNPGLRPGPPRFASVRMPIGEGVNHATIRLRYLL